MSELIDRDELKKHLMDMTRLRTNSEIGEPTCGLTRRTMFHMSDIMREVVNVPTAGPCPLGKDECNEDCTEYFIAYSG